jgi:hypothetical protein
MKVSKQFLRDLAYIANLYSWNVKDVEDAKAQTRANPGEMRPYWTRLAAAHRAGYQQTVDNNFMRLGQWAQLQGNGRSNLGAPRRRGKEAPEAKPFTSNYSWA